MSGNIYQRTKTPHQTSRTTTRYITLFVCMLLVCVCTYCTIASPHSVAAQTYRRCFPETGQCITGRIREFWETNGGLAVFGMPITPQIQEWSEGNLVTVQWFERHRLELHPENAPPYDVLLGRLGADSITDKNTSWQPPTNSDIQHPTTQQENDCRFFPQTGYQVCGDILAAWQHDGIELDGTPGVSDAESLALYGLPLTDLHLETFPDGSTYRVQWFERARFELHPDNPPPYHVQRGLLGSEQQTERNQSWSRYEIADCPFSIPGDMNVECGYLTVPEQRGDPDSQTIQLAVAIVHTSAPNPAPDSVVYLSGGPGAAALEQAIPFARGWAHMLESRDFVVFDQRGTGHSIPSLDCPESTQLTQELLGQDITRAAKVQAEVDTALHCRERLAQSGINLAAYTSAASAADMHDLRQALGYRSWNLFGISYGTRLALTAMRDYPQDIRSAMLDSTYPLQVNLFTAMPANFSRSLSLLFTTCTNDPVCNQTYPDLETVFRTLVAQLNEDPITVWPSDPLTNEAVPIRVDGTELVSVLFRLLYDTYAIPDLPQMIYDTYNGNDGLLTRMQQRRLNRTAGTFSHGMYFSISCSEEIAFATEEDVNASIETDPLLTTFFTGIPENTPEIFRLCTQWGVHPPDPIENQPVSSSIPTLFLAGEYDPITPPSWARLAASTLETSYVYEFPATGHAVISRGICPLTIMHSFLSNPMTPPDASCIGQ